MNIGLRVLKAKLRGFQAAGQSITNRISKSVKDKKNRLWDDKRRLGTYCRHHLIAYGFLRGIPYDQIERCAKNNQPDPHWVLRIMQDHDTRAWDIEKVKSLLSPQVSPQQAHEKAA